AVPTVGHRRGLRWRAPADGRLSDPPRGEDRSGLLPRAGRLGRPPVGRRWNTRREASTRHRPTTFRGLRAELLSLGGLEPRPAHVDALDRGLLLSGAPDPGACRDEIRIVPAEPGGAPDGADRTRALLERGHGSRRAVCQGAPRRAALL